MMNESDECCESVNDLVMKWGKHVRYEQDVHPSEEVPSCCNSSNEQANCLEMLDAFQV